MRSKTLILRIVHGFIAVYFLFCLAYMYYAIFAAQYSLLLIVCVVSLGLEGIVVFGLNEGNCPLIHLQKRVGDEKPFFELFFPPKVAKLAIPVFAAIVLIAVVLLFVQYLQVV